MAVMLLDEKEALSADDKEEIEKGIRLLRVI